MALCHLECAKRIRGIEYGSSRTSESTGRCLICNLAIEPGVTVVDRFISEIDSYREGSKPKPPVPAVDLDALVRSLLPNIMKGVNEVLPKMLEDYAGNALQKSASQAVKAELFKRIQDIGAPIKIQVNDLPVIDAGFQHYQFPLLVKALIAGVNVWLAGPSGSGKTTAAINVAKALGVPFRYTGAVGDPYGLLGFRDATGGIVRTPFRDAWENGGIFLWDEVDASDPNALLAFNAALANGSCAFPDAVVPRHGACLVIAAANTWGHGATNEYVGRNKIDAAFLKRFAFIDWQYDEALERNTCSNKEWCATVQSVRKRVKDSKIRVLVTPRETYTGEKLLAAGCTVEETLAMTVRAGMSDEQWSKVKPPTPLPQIPPVDIRTDWIGVQDAEPRKKPIKTVKKWDLDSFRDGTEGET